MFKKKKIPKRIAVKYHQRQLMSETHRSVNDTQSEGNQGKLGQVLFFTHLSH